MKGELCTLAPEGDLKTVWDAGKPDEVAMAREQFEKMRKKGYLAFKVDKKGGKGEVITAFDPEAEKLILSPPIRGG